LTIIGTFEPCLIVEPLAPLISLPLLTVTTCVSVPLSPMKIRIVLSKLFLFKASVSNALNNGINIEPLINIFSSF